MSAGDGKGRTYAGGNFAAGGQGRAMPLWLLFDPQGQLVLSLSTPTSPQEHLRMIELLTRITDAQRET